MAAVIEVDGYKLDEKKLMKLRIEPERGTGELRLILPTTAWNASGKFLAHDLASGRVEPIDDIVALLKRQGLLEQVLVPD